MLVIVELVSATSQVVVAPAEQSPIDPVMSTNGERLIVRVIVDVEAIQVPGGSSVLIVRFTVPALMSAAEGV